MGLRAWLFRRLGGDAPMGDPDEVVEVALVQLWESELIVTELGRAGIAARAVPDHSAVGTREQLRPMARLFARRGDARRAFEVIVGVQRGAPAREPEWPPVTDPAGWPPPRADGALP